MIIILNKDINFIIHYLKMRYKIKKNLIYMNSLKNYYLISAIIVKRYIRYCESINKYKKDMKINKALIFDLLQYVKYNYNENLYKFLYNDSRNSIPQDYSVFEIPYQLEQQSSLKYRISRASEPLGIYENADLTADGKAIIDYSKYKEEVSGTIDGQITYNFEITIGIRRPTQLGLLKYIPSL